jgi:SSS family solute:Na+ symporter
MSCLSAGINATITVISKDFIETAPSSRGRNEAEQLRLARLLSLGLGLAVIAGSVGIGSVRGNLFEITQKTVQLLAGPLFGLFFLAMFVRYSTPFGAIFGALYSTAAAVIVGYWDILTGLPGLSFLWITPVSFAVTMAAGFLFSRMPTRGRSPRALALYSLATSIPLAGAVGWIILIRR